MTHRRSRSAQRRIPLSLKVAYTVFLSVLIPYYWVAYTPWNFLYFCDLALFFTLLALWLENPFLASMPAVGITLPQILWLLDFCTGGNLVGMTAYMFNPDIKLFTRGLSLFHGWLPILLWWMLWRLGYDRRALVPQIVLAEVVLLICFFFGPAPPPPSDSPSAAVNINYVYGMNDARPQKWMSPYLWLLLMMFLHPAMYGLTHLVFLKIFRRRGPAKPKGGAAKP